MLFPLLITRRTCFVVLLLSSIGISHIAAQDEPSSSGPTAAIDGYIAMLGEDRFQRREVATRKLIEIGETSIVPLVQEVAVSTDREVVTRAFVVLKDLATGSSTREVLDALKPFLDETSIQKPMLRRLSLDVFDAIEHSVVEHLVDLGAEFQFDGRRKVTRVDFDSSWNGGDHDLKDLWRLRNLRTIDCEHSNISDAAVPFLAGVAKLDKLYLGNCAVAGKTLKSLEGHTQLRYLSLIGQPLCDEAYDSLAEIQGLTQLGLDETDTTDDQLAKLKGLTNLQTLWLTNSQVTDKGLALVTEFKNLSRIVLAGTKIRGPGLQHLRSLPNLTSVSLKELKLDAGHLGPLRQIKTLERIDVIDSQVNDDDFAELAGMPQMKRLWLNGTQVTEASLETLLSFPKLERLYIDRDVLSPEAIKKLKGKFPKLRLTIPTKPGESK